MVTRHRVTWEQDAHGAHRVQLTCLGQPGAYCRRGCPDPECDDWYHWGAYDAGCEHCDERCDCENWPCCDIAQQHGAGAECPHRWTDLGHCWVLAAASGPWGWDGDLPDVAPGRWAITYSSWTTDDDGIVTLTDPGHPVRVINQGGNA